MIRSESVGPAGRPDVAGGVGPAVRIPGPAPAGRGEPAAVQVVEAVILLMDDDEPFDLRDFVAGGGAETVPDPVARRAATRDGLCADSHRLGTCALVDVSAAGGGQADRDRLRAWKSPEPRWGSCNWPVLPL